MGKLGKTSFLYLVFLKPHSFSCFLESALNVPVVVSQSFYVIIVAVSTPVTVFSVILFQDKSCGLKFFGSALK